MGLPKTSEVVVIGGGFMGTSTAYQLAKRGVEVTLLERNEIGRHASGTNWGFVWVQTHPAGHALDLALASSEMYRTLADELSFDIEYVQCGGMMPLEREDYLDSARQIVERQQKAGVDIELLTTENIRHMEPALSKDLFGAIYSPVDGKVNPILLTMGLAEGIRKQGGRVFTGTRVRAIEMRNGEIHAVVTDKGRIKTHKVVNAAGAWARKVADMVGLEVPIVVHQGEVLVTEPLPPLFSLVAYSGSYVTGMTKVITGDATETLRAIDPLWYYGVRQHANGNITLGSGTGIRDYMGFDKRGTYRKLKELVEWSAKVIPSLKNVNIIRSWAGVKSGSLSRAAGGVIIDEVNFGKSSMVLVVDTGHGVARCPINGRLAAELMTAGRDKTSLPLDRCRLVLYSKENISTV
jgi:glycine/D-amino acid oxidase-like deaminating enzyme